MRVHAGGVPRGRGAVPHRPRRRRRVHVHLGLARGSVRGRGHRLRPRPRAGDERDSRRQGDERQDRFPHDRRAAARRDAPASLRLPGRDAVDARSAPAGGCTWSASAASSWRTFRTRARRTTCWPSRSASRIPGNREGVVDHFPDPIVRKGIEVDVALIGLSG